MITRKIVFCALFVLIACGGMNTLTAAELRTGLLAGYQGGPGAQLSTAMSDFAEGFPLAVRVGIGYSVREAGRAADARRIFINDATNGTPEEHGSFFDYRFDLMYPFGWRAAKELYLISGVRYSQSTSNFKFIGGNEDFDITSSQWGFGLGMEAAFPMSQKFDFIVSGGIDYYLSSTLSGHDTSYSPDGEDVNPRRDYTFDDASNAVNQPDFEPRFMIGVGYKF